MPTTGIRIRVRHVPEDARSLRRVASVTLSDAARVLSALSYPRRLDIVTAVTGINEASGPASLMAVAQKLGVDVKSLSKDVVRLLESRLLRREQGGGLVVDLGTAEVLARGLLELTTLHQAIPPESPLRRYLLHGRVGDLPKRPEDLDAMADVLASLLPPDQVLSESEVNGILLGAGDDVASLRRLLVDLGRVHRTGSARYWRPSSAATASRAL
jgi:predicted transcriptional regulator